MPRGIYSSEKRKGLFKKGHKGYNSWLGKKMSEESRKKMSKAHLGKPRAGNPESWKHTEETKRKLSKSHKGKRPWRKGIPVSKETKIKISKRVRKVMKNLDIRKKISEIHKGIKLSKEHKKKISKVLKGKMPINKQRPGKFGNIQRGYFNINGKKIFFRSKWEANYALYLDFLVKQKQIKKWEYELDVFVFDKIQFGTRSYRPDFKITNNDDTTEYHEIKGWMDKKSQIKLKRMAKYYPEIKLILIEKDSYVDIKNKIGKMLNFF